MDVVWLVFLESYASDDVLRAWPFTLSPKSPPGKISSLLTTRLGSERRRHLQLVGQRQMIRLSTTFLLPFVAVR